MYFRVNVPLFAKIYIVLKKSCSLDLGLKLSAWEQYFAPSTTSPNRKYDTLFLLEYLAFSWASIFLNFSDSEPDAFLKYS